MIRFLQQDSRFTKALFVVIIGFASVSMVVYLIPGLMGGGSVSDDAYAIVYPHWYSRLLSSGAKVTNQHVQQMVSQQLQRQNPELVNNPFIVKFYTQRVGQQMVQQQVELVEARRLGLTVTDADIQAFLHKGQFGQFIFPKGNYIGDDQYAALIDQYFHISTTEFEAQLRDQILGERLRSMVTASVTVSDDEIRDEYRKHNVRIKFDYAVINGDELRKGINPTDAELQSFFTKNAARYATAVPETRSISYFSFTIDQLPGGLPKATDQEVQQYYNLHKAEYQVPETARVRHILIKVSAGADAKADAAAKAKAEGILKQIKPDGSNFAELAQKNSDDTGSKDTGGEYAGVKRGTMVKEFDNATFNQKIGELAIIKTQYGYHIVQVEDRQTAHAQSLNEVQMTIQMTLIRQKVAQAEENYAKTLATEAQKNGLEKTAKAHGLEFATTEQLPAKGVIPALPNSTQIMTKAFEAKQGDAPQYAETGEGYAVFQIAKIAPAHAPDFNIYKDRILEEYRSDRLPSLLTQKATELASKAKTEKDLAKAAKELGATVKSSDLVGESAQVPDMGPVNADLFKLNVGDISGPISSQRNAIVAKLVDKQVPSADEINKNLDQTRDQVVEQKRGDVYNIFINSLMDNYKKEKRIVYGKQAADADATPAVPGKAPKS
jgi:peptidyl-prolyl cis-trans isomerase D